MKRRTKFEKQLQQPFIDKELNESAAYDLLNKKGRFDTYEFQTMDEDEQDAEDANNGELILPNLKRRRSTKRECNVIEAKQAE